MRRLIINKISIKNFKGIKDLTINPDGKNLFISGENASGKTTIVDAFFYVLFGKDSTGKTEFGIKPLNSDGQEIHHLETEVEIYLDYNSSQISLMKRYFEKWTKKRGMATKEFTGHMTDHFIDNVPVKKKDYELKISEIIEHNIFRLVTNPFGFSGLNWADRRALLMSICGDVENTDVINSAFKDEDQKTKLNTMLGNSTLEDQKKRIKAGQKRINDELKQIPARISENIEISKAAEKPAKKDKEIIEKKISREKKKLIELQSNEALSSKRTELNEVIGEIQKVKNDADHELAEKSQDIRSAIDELLEKKRGISNEILDIQNAIDRNEAQNKLDTGNIKQLRSDWNTENSKQPRVESYCPTCGQDIPEDKIKETTKKFNQSKSAQLEKINNTGINLTKEIKERDKQISLDKLSVEKLNKKLHRLSTTLANKKDKLSKIKVDFDVSEIENKKEILESEILALANGSLIQERTAERKIKELEEKLSEWNIANANYIASRKAIDRIKELETQEKNLAKEYELLESELFLIEKFIIAKVETIEADINSKFKMAKFKLFETQINGGIKECCEILYKGVPFDHGLNNAARINIGLDIINTLSEHYNFSAPVFIDNRESVNNLIDVNSQIINLVVSKDKTLTIKKG